MRDIHAADGCSDEWGGDARAQALDGCTQKRIGGGPQRGLAGANIHHRGARVGDVLAQGRKRKRKGEEDDSRNLCIGSSAFGNRKHPHGTSMPICLP